MKTAGIWIVLGTLVLVAILGFGSYELVQRKRFSDLDTEIDAALHEFERAGNVVPMGPNEGPLRLATASDTPATCYQLNRMTWSERTAAGMADWTLNADMKSAEGGYICNNFHVALRQERSYLLLYPPRVFVVSFSGLHASVLSLLNRVFKDHGVEYSRAATIP